MKWDNLLIKGWHRDAPMRNLVAMYLEREDPEFDQWDQIRRFPKAWEYPMTARVFVARYIPKLSARLFDNPKDATYWLMLHGDKVKRQSNPADGESRRRDVAEIRSTVNHNAASRKIRIKYNANWDAHKLSEQWGKCK
jgi:hypothetical protein